MEGFCRCWRRALIMSHLHELCHVTLPSAPDERTFLLASQKSKVEHNI